MACGDEILKGSATGAIPLLFKLQPGVPQTVEWDFTDCWFLLQNFTVFVTKPRNKKGFQAALSSSTPLTVTAELITSTGTAYFGANSFVLYFGTVARAKVRVTLTLAAGAKPLDVEVSHTEGMAGAA